MHEATIASGLLGTVLRAAADAGAKKISVVKIAVGRLRAVEVALLESCFEFMAENTICEGARLISRIVPVTARCRDCGVTSTIPSFHFRCDGCASGRLDILTGRELQLVSITANAI